MFDGACAESSTLKDEGFEMASGADALLFDLGRVVIDIDFNLAFAKWAEHARCDQAAILQRFSHDDAYRRSERGEIDAEQYFSALRLALGVEISNAQLLDGWNAIFIGEMPGISSLLEKAARRVPLYALSNSNREHERCWSTRFSGVLRHFREIYVSSTIGRRKPEAEAYNYVVKAIGTTAERIAFFDDILENVDAARACGLQGFHVKSSAEVANAVASLAL
jgi:glucose-1-phosphatase